MTKVSRAHLQPEELGRLTHEFWNALALLRTGDQIEALLAGFLTHTEVKMFAKRLQIAKMLLSGSSYADICRALKVTDVPISRISNLLHGNRRFRRIVERMIKNTS